MHAFLDDVEVNDIDFEGSKVWVCTQSSVVCIDTISGQKTFYDYSKYEIGHHIKSLKIDGLGNKLILDSYGLHILHANNSWSHFNSLNSYLFRLHKDLNSTIWVVPFGTQQANTSFYKWNNGILSTFNCWTSYMPYRMSFDSSGNAYYIENGNNHNVCKLDTNMNVTKYNSSNSNLINSPFSDVCSTPDGTLWVVYNSAPYISRISNIGIIDNFSFATYGIALAGNNNVNAFCDQNNNIYFYRKSVNGIYKYDGTNFSHITAPNINLVHLLCLNVSNTNSIYFGGMYNSDTPVFYKVTNVGIINIDLANSQITGNQIRSTVIDHAGNKWIATDDAGIIKYDGITWQRYTTQNGQLISNKIRDITVAHDNAIWFVCDSFKVGKIENGNISYSQDLLPLYPYNGSDHFCGIIEDKYNNIWVHGRSGLYKFDGIMWNAYNPAPQLYHSAFVHPYFGSNNIISDSTGNIWIATWGLGLAKFDLSNQFTFYNTGFASSPYDAIYKIYCDKNNNIIVSPNVNGTSLLFNGSTFSNFTINGFRINHVIEESDSTNLYITEDGLYRTTGSTFFKLLDIKKLEMASGFTKDLNNNIWISMGYEMGLLCFNESGLNSNSFLNAASSASSVSGMVYFDQNQNGILEPNDVGLPWKGVKNNTNNTVAYTNLNGNFTQYLPDGAYTIQENFQAQSNYILTSDSATFHVNLNQSNASNLNFGAFTDANQDSVVVNFTPGLVRCNTTVNNWITITNYSVFPFTGDVNLQFDDSVTFSFNNIQGILNGNTATWHIDSLAPFQSITISFITANPTVSFIINNPTGTIDYALSVTNPSVLYSSNHSFNLLCSYDPNFKEVNPPGVGFQNHTLQNTPFEYTLHFQNMGNDTAFHVLVTDTLSSILNPETFEYIAASHTVNITRIGNILKFDFPEINLLPKSMNEPLSQGFVKFRIKTFENLPDYTVLTNTANIYFDFNPPVITNTSLNTLVYELDVNVDELSNLNNQVLIYPNPAKNILTIDTQNISIENCIILNTLGQTVYNSANEINANHKIQLNISNLRAGVYFVKVRSSNGFYNAKFIKSE